MGDGMNLGWLIIGIVLLVAAIALAEKFFKDQIALFREAKKYNPKSWGFRRKK